MFCLIRLKSIFINLLFSVLLGVCCVSAYSQEQSTPFVEQDESGYYYTIQKGDTLWGLSQKFFNSPFLWPDLWEANNDLPIHNPHLIYPGQKIRLYKKLEERVVMEQDMTLPDIPKVLDYDFIPADIPPAAPPRLSTLERPGVKDDTIIDYSQIDRVGFVRNPPIKPHGKIIETDGENAILSTGNIVYLQQIGREPIILGRQYTIYRTFDMLKDHRTGEDLGVQHYFLGVVEIIKREPLFYIGKITRSFHAIHLNDLIMPFERRSPTIKKTKGKEGLMGYIIASEEEHSNLLGQHSVAFINRGAVNGIIPGQVYDIFYQKDAEINPVTGERIRLTPVVFGQFVVLLTEEKTSTVLITFSTQVIYPGSTFMSSLN